MRGRGFPSRVRPLLELYNLARSTLGGWWLTRRQTSRRIIRQGSCITHRGKVHLLGCMLRLRCGVNHGLAQEERGSKPRGATRPTDVRQLAQRGLREKNEASNHEAQLRGSLLAQLSQTAFGKDVRGRS